MWLNTHLPNSLTPLLSAIMPFINRTQILYVPQFLILSVWFLQARCGLLFTTINHTQYSFLRKSFRNQCFMRALLSCNPVHRYLQNLTSCMLLTIPYPLNLIKDHHHGTGTIVTKRET